MECTTSGFADDGKEVYNADYCMYVPDTFGVDRIVEGFTLPKLSS